MCWSSAARSPTANINCPTVHLGGRWPPINRMCRLAPLSPRAAGSPPAAAKPQQFSSAAKLAEGCRRTPPAAKPARMLPPLGRQRCECAAPWWMPRPPLPRPDPVVRMWEWRSSAAAAGLLLAAGRAVLRHVQGAGCDALPDGLVDVGLLLVGVRGEDVQPPRRPVCAKWQSRVRIKKLQLL